MACFNCYGDINLDWKAIHIGLPGTSEKWIVNHWYHLTNLPLRQEVDTTEVLVLTEAQ